MGISKRLAYFSCVKAITVVTFGKYIVSKLFINRCGGGRKHPLHKRVRMLYVPFIASLHIIKCRIRFPHFRKSKAELKTQIAIYYIVLVALYHLLYLPEVLQGLAVIF